MNVQYSINRYDLNHTNTLFRNTRAEPIWTKSKQINTQCKRQKKNGMLLKHYLTFCVINSEGPRISDFSYWQMWRKREKKECMLRIIHVWNMKCERKYMLSKVYLPLHYRRRALEVLWFCKISLCCLATTSFAPFFSAFLSLFLALSLYLLFFFFFFCILILVDFIRVFFNFPLFASIFVSFSSGWYANPENDIRVLSKSFRCSLFFSAHIISFSFSRPSFCNTMMDSTKWWQ